MWVEILIVSTILLCFYLFIVFPEWKYRYQGPLNGGLYRWQMNAVGVTVRAANKLGLISLAKMPPQRYVDLDDPDTHAHVAATIAATGTAPLLTTGIATTAPPTTVIVPPVIATTAPQMPVIATTEVQTPPIVAVQPTTPPVAVDIVSPPDELLNIVTQSASTAYAAAVDANASTAIALNNTDINVITGAAADSTASALIATKAWDNMSVQLKPFEKQPTLPTSVLTKIAVTAITTQAAQLAASAANDAVVATTRAANPVVVGLSLTYTDKDGNSVTSPPQTDAGEQTKARAIDRAAQAISMIANLDSLVAAAIKRSKV